MKNWLASTILALALSSCATPLLIGGAVVGSGILVYQDRRDTGQILDDQTLESSINHAINQQLKGRAFVTVVVYNNVVLLAGQAGSQKAIDHANYIASTLAGEPSRIINKLYITEKPLTKTAVLKDSLLTTKVKKALAASKKADQEEKSIYLHTKVVTVDKTVFLIGLLNPTEQQKAKKAAKKVSGVKEIISIFHPWGDEE